MSRDYSMNVKIGEFQLKNLCAVKNALEKETGMEWEYDGIPDILSYQGHPLLLGCGEEQAIHRLAGLAHGEIVNVSCRGDGDLCRGETEGEFAKRVAVAIWKANGGFCNVNVSLTPLTNSEVYSFDDISYKDIMEEEQ